MKPFIISIGLVSVIVLLSACNLPRSGQPIQDEPQVIKTVEPTQGYETGECAFMWANGPLPDLSKEFDQNLKESLPNAEGYAEAYGENCITETGEIARFLAMETDYHVTLTVDDLDDKQTLGSLIEEIMGVLSEFPPENTPGPQPGYIGIIFEAPDDSIRLWFMRTDVEIALENGLQGEDLFNALQNK